MTRLFPTTLLAIGAAALIATPTNAAPAKDAGKGKPAASGSTQTAGTGGKRERYESFERVCSDQDGEKRTITYTGPTEMWPPNHKYRDFTVVAKDSDGGPVSLVTRASHNEFLEDSSEINGTGNTDNDFQDTTPMGANMGEGSATTTGGLRAERSGHRDPDGDGTEDGRIYTVTSTATWEDGSMCTKEFQAHVPHDQGKGAGGLNQGSGANNGG